MAPAAEDKTVTQILTGPGTWVSWYREFTNTMEALRLLEYFQGTQELLAEPPTAVTNPLRIMERAQERRRKIAEEKGVAFLALTDEELDGADDATLDITMAITPPDSETEDEQARGTPATAPTAAQKKAARKAVDDYFQAYGLFVLQSIQNLHDTRRKDWAAQNTRLDKARTFLNTTVAISLRNAHFLSGGSLRDWYQGLKAVAEARHETVSGLRERMNNHYATLKGKATTQAEFSRWLTQWETLMGEATLYNLPEISTEGAWFDDYTRAIGTVVPMYAAIVRTDRLAKPHQSYKDLAAAARQAAFSLLPSTTNPRSDRIQKGAFPTFGSQPASGANDTNSAHKRKASSLPNERAKCRLCYGRHRLERCAYIMPHLAPEGFELRDHVRERVEQNIATDTSLKAEVDRIQNKRVKASNNKQQQQPDGSAQGN